MVNLVSFKAFLSHKCEDAKGATLIAEHLRAGGVNTYVDVFDPDAQDGPALADYLRRRLAECSGLIAVISSVTARSWWVPWEIGIATERDMPLATYSHDRTAVPSYLKKWPYMTSLGDVDAYIKEVQLQLVKRRLLVAEGRLEQASMAPIPGRAFNRSLRARLGQD